MWLIINTYFFLSIKYNVTAKIIDNGLIKNDLSCIEMYFKHIISGLLSNLSEVLGL